MPQHGKDNNDCCDKYNNAASSQNISRIEYKEPQHDQSPDLVGSPDPLSLSVINPPPAFQFTLRPAAPEEQPAKPQQIDQAHECQSLEKEKPRL